MTQRVITIDGPSGTGKGTTAQGLAARLDWQYLDSGAVYRVLALASLRSGISTDDIPSLVALTESIHMAFVTHHQHWCVELEGEDVTAALRDETVGNQASKLSVHPSVRASLLALQRSFAKPQGLVTDGRDMGTIVFPDAMLKVYLEASASVRAARRFKQLKDNGKDVNLDRIYEDMVERDRRDRERSASPTKPAADALIIDTSELTSLEVIDVIADKARLLLKTGA